MTVEQFCEQRGITREQLEAAIQAVAWKQVILLDAFFKLEALTRMEIDRRSDMREWDAEAFVAEYGDLVGSLRDMTDG